MLRRFDTIRGVRDRLTDSQTDNNTLLWIASSDKNDKVVNG